MPREFGGLEKRYLYTFSGQGGSCIGASRSTTDDKDLCMLYKEVKCGASGYEEKYDLGRERRWGCGCHGEEGKE